MGKKKEKLAEDQPLEETPQEPKKSKREKRKPPSESNDQQPTTEDEPSTKKSKLINPGKQPIAAGTTIDQALLVNPALKLNKKTQRGKKREKHAKNEDERKEKAKEREKEEVRQYLQTWNDDRDQWKFQKLKQIYIQEHVFDEDHLDGDIWPLVLEYVSGTKGSGREGLTKRAESVIKEVDQQAKDGGDESLLDGSKYQRARELLQYLG
ncbi:uncharacterized protein C7orf50 homolog [Ochlerotatus camptorhynchus]|uniref:uncharacterized protein C7orf50 homolog n=1 Tax=Ochlerotatus camptorhynchus TaxID=644619 RepID=UPI0031D48272